MLDHQCFLNVFAQTPKGFHKNFLASPQRVARRQKLFLLLGTEWFVVVGWFLFIDFEVKRFRWVVANTSDPIRQTQGQNAPLWKSNLSIFTFTFHFQLPPKGEKQFRLLVFTFTFYGKCFMWKSKPIQKYFLNFLDLPVGQKSDLSE